MAPKLGVEVGCSLGILSAGVGIFLLPITEGVTVWSTTMARREEQPPDPAVGERQGRDGTRPDDRGTVEDRVVPVGNGAGVAAFVLGMLAATLAFLVVAAPAAVLFGIVAVVLGFVGVGKANVAGGVHKGLAVTGIVSGALGLLLGAAVLLGGFAFLDRLQQDPELQEELEELQEEVEELGQ